MSVEILSSSGPHTISGTKSLVTLRLKVIGLHFDPQHIGKKPADRHGHVQIYLDRVPVDARTKVDMKGVFAVTGAPEFSIGVTQAWIKRHRGHHQLLVTLARNNDVLYNVKPAALAVTVM